MGVVKVEGIEGPVEHLVTAVWRADDGTIRILLDDPETEKFLVIILDPKGEGLA